MRGEVSKFEDENHEMTKIVSSEYPLNMADWLEMKTKEMKGDDNRKRARTYKEMLIFIKYFCLSVEYNNYKNQIEKESLEIIFRYGTTVLCFSFAECKRYCEYKNMIETVFFLSERIRKKEIYSKHLISNNYKRIKKIRYWLKLIIRNVDCF